MIKAKVIFDNNNNYKAFSCSGHAGYAEHGQDIVCAAVSILVINTANAIDELTNNVFSATQDDGIINFVFKDVPDEKAKLLMDAMILGLNEIQKLYGKNYLIIKTEKISGGK